MHSERCSSELHALSQTITQRKRRRRWDVGSETCSCQPIQDSLAPSRLEVRSLTAQHPRSPVLKLLSNQQRVRLIVNSSLIGMCCPPTQARSLALSTRCSCPQKLDLQRTRAARRLHVAKVPAGTCPGDLVLFFNALMRATNCIAVAGPNAPVISCTVRGLALPSSAVIPTGSTVSQESEQSGTADQSTTAR